VKHTTDNIMADKYYKSHPQQDYNTNLAFGQQQNLKEEVDVKETLVNHLANTLKNGQNDVGDQEQKGQDEARDMIKMGQLLQAQQLMNELQVSYFTVW
jgi:hypothetical protein